MSRAALLLVLLSSCAAAVAPDASADVAGDLSPIVDVPPAIDAGAPVACVNSSTCRPDLACLQGFCSTPCATYEAGCD